MKPHAPSVSTAMSDDGWYVYIVRCSDATLYTGIARDPERREREHNGALAGGARYTRARRPVQLVYRRQVENRAQAARQEYKIKHLTRQAKEALIRQNQDNAPGTEQDQHL